MSLVETLKSDNMIILMTMLLLILLGTVIYLISKISTINKKYEKFIRKIGNSKNIEKDLEKYMNRVENVVIQNSQISKACDILDNNIKECIQKIGIVRYNAFTDTGSELSFALALLDRENSGIVLNGIYSREGSNIYAKPVEKGISTFKISKEEEEAIAKAMRGK